jgi:hypothetical protein
MYYSNRGALLTGNSIKQRFFTIGGEPGTFSYAEIVERIKVRIFFGCVKEMCRVISIISYPVCRMDRTFTGWVNDIAG